MDINDSVSQRERERERERERGHTIFFTFPKFNKRIKVCHIEKSLKVPVSNTVTKSTRRQHSNRVRTDHRSGLHSGGGG